MTRVNKKMFTHKSQLKNIQCHNYKINAQIFLKAKKQVTKKLFDFTVDKIPVNVSKREKLPCNVQYLITYAFARTKIINIIRTCYNFII